MDDNLYFENVPQERQPGTHVRRVNGKELTDDEMIEYYSNLAKEFGGRIESKWIYGMVVFSPKGSFEHSWSLGHCYIVDKPSSKRNPGYPISSLSIDKYTGKYLSDMTPEDKEKNEKNYNENHVVKFISECIY